MTTVTRYVSHNPHEAESLGSGFPIYEDLCARIEVLTDALKPFADVDGYERYPDDHNAEIGAPVTKELCTEAMRNWDASAAKGHQPPYERPDPETGWKNWPQQVFSLDGVTVGDLRRARDALNPEGK